MLISQRGGTGSGEVFFEGTVFAIGFGFAEIFAGIDNLGVIVLEEVHFRGEVMFEEVA